MENNAYEIQLMSLQQLDALLDFEATTQDLNNGVINGAFMLLFRDLIRLFACYNDGIINLLGALFVPIISMSPFQ